jgi:hypothetical protein
LIGNGYLEFDEYREMRNMPLADPSLADARFSPVSIFFERYLYFGD